MPTVKDVAVVTGAAVGGGVLTIVATPLIVGALGFGAGGIAAGSIGASMMSYMAPTVAGGVVATLQSVGAAGLGLGGTAAVGAVGSATGAGVGGALSWVFGGKKDEGNQGEDNRPKEASPNPSEGLSLLSGQSHTMKVPKTKAKEDEMPMIG